MRRFAFIAVGLALLTGCGTAQLTSTFSEEEPTQQKAVVYLYRLNTAHHSLSPDIPTFYFNNKKIGTLNIGGYYAQEVDPGPLEISFSDSFFGVKLWRSGRRVKIDVVAGRSYFVKYELGMMALYFDQVPAAYGFKEIQSTKLLKP